MVTIDLKTASRGQKIAFFVFFALVLAFIGGVFIVIQKFGGGGGGLGPTLTGTVVRADGDTAIAGARVVLRLDRDAMEAVTKKDGSFELMFFGRDTFTDRALPLVIVAPGYQVLETEVTLPEGKTDLGRHALTALPPAEPRTKTVVVVGPEIDTGLDAVGGETIEITASGTLVFRGATTMNPRVDRGPEGESRNASTDEPAPGLRSRSLLFRVGDAAWRQGSPRVVHVAERPGKVLLRANGPVVAENPQGWSVTVTVRREPLGEAPSSPR